MKISGLIQPANSPSWIDRALSGRVAGLWVYPVKSMRGQALDVAEIETRGVVGDRLYTVRDEAGKFGSGKNTRRFARMDGLARWSARRNGESVEVRPPDGYWLDHASERAATLLSAQIERPVVVAREGSVSHFDAAPIHIVTTGDLARLRQWSGVSPDCESFRPNILIETADLSSDWFGRTLQIGLLRLEVGAPTERRLMVNVTPDGRPGPDLLRPIAQFADARFGVYGNVARTGRIAMGESVTIA
jgi:uncharacterized protein YcbX